MLHIILFQLQVLLFQVVPPDIWTTLVPLIISVATPFVVKWATDLAVKLLPTFSGLGIVVIIVPLLSGVLVWITNFLAGLVNWTTPTWYYQLILGLGAVFVNELVKQFKQTPMSFKKAA